MKQLSENKTETAVKLLLQTLIRNQKDICVVLDEFESIHNEFECNSSSYYSALVIGHCAITDAIEAMTNRLNKSK